MYILKAISEDNYAEVVDSITSNISLIDPYEKNMLEMQGALATTGVVEKLEFMLGVYDSNNLYLIARHRDELTNTIASAYSTRKYVTAVEKCNSINAMFRQQGYNIVCTVLPKSRAKALLSLNRAEKKKANRLSGGH